MRFLKLLFILFIIPYFRIYAQDIEDTSIIKLEVKEVTITATKKEKEIQKVPFPVSIIDSKKISSTGSSTLDQVIKNETGIITVPTRTGTEGVQIQGVDASYTTVLIDGYPLIGRSFGTLNLQRVSVNDVKRIELLKGASSSLYGSSAIGGVINVISNRLSEDGKRFTGKLKLGSYNTVNPNLSYQFKKDPFRFSTSLDYYETSGYDLIKTDMLKTVNPFYNYTSHSNLGLSLSKKLILEGTLRYYYQNQLNTSLSLDDEKLEGESTIKEWNAGYTLKYMINNNLSQEINIYGAYYRTDEFLEDLSNNLYDQKYFDNSLVCPELITRYNRKNIDVMFGVGSENEKLARTDFLETKEQKLNFTYGQIDVRVFKFINLILGSRFDNYTNYDSHFSNKLGIGLNLSKALLVNGSVGSGFKTPDFRQRYFDFTSSTFGYTVLGRDVVLEELTNMQEEGLIVNTFIPLESLNTPLSAEKSTNINLGLRYNLSAKLNFDINFFKNKIYNLIETQLIANINALPVFSYFNVNQVETRGLEFNTKWNSNKWEIKTGYQLLYAFDSEVKESFSNGEIYAKDENGISFQLEKSDYIGLFNRSKHMGNLQISHINKNSTYNISFRYRSKYGLSDSNGNEVFDKYDNFIKDYTLCDISYITKITKHQSAQLGIDNLFNFTYPQYISNTPGRRYYLILKFNIK
ncbi:MAG: TonB-dependent receptor [Bacteroidota bacterium]|nr:TonB-dependent receptor [Bacteroidota bacterium]